MSKTLNFVLGYKGKVTFCNKLSSVWNQNDQ